MFNVKTYSKMKKEEKAAGKTAEEKLDEILYLTKLNAKAIRLLLLIAIGERYRYESWEIEKALINLELYKEKDPDRKGGEI